MFPPHFFSHLGKAPPPAPSARKSVIRLHRKLPSEPPASTQEVSESEVPVHVPLRRPRPFRFERLPVLVWNPYSRGRLGPAKSEDPKGGEGKVDANLTNFLSTDAAGGTPTRPPRPGEAPHPAPSAWRASWGATRCVDRKSTRLNSSHGYISYAVFCFKKKK